MILNILITIWLIGFIFVMAIATLQEKTLDWWDFIAGSLWPIVIPIGIYFKWFR